MTTSQDRAGFLRVLKHLRGFSKTKAFAYACKQQQSNMTSYLRAGEPTGKVPGDALLSSCLEELYAWQIQPIAEVVPLPRPLNKITTDAGVYSLYDHNFNVIYIGKAINLRDEINQTLNRAVPGLVARKIKHRAEYYSLYLIESEKLRHNLEQLLIRVFGHQTYNTNVGDYK